MPLGAIVARRFCGVCIIGNPASHVSHSKPLEVSGDTGTPGSVKSGLGWQWWLVAGIPPILGDCATQWWGCPTLDAGKGARCGVQMGRVDFDT